MIARVVFVASLLALSACSTGKDESWIGKNAGVVIDSEAETVAPQR